MWFQMLSLSSSLLLLCELALTTAVSFDRITSVVNGAAEYSGTAVSVFNPLPTLMYNCDEMPAICKNVEQYMNTNNLAPMGAGWEFHYHNSPGSKGHTKRRGSAVCPSTWAKNRVPQCGTDPTQPNVVPGNLPPIVMAKTAAGLGKFNYEIPDTTGASSGMAFTCDEFPARSWIEGGTGPQGRTTSTYCAPKQVSCAGTQWKAVLATNPNYPDTASEQDWQGRAHAFIGAYAAARSADVMKFHFTTTRMGTNAVRTAVQVILPQYEKLTTKTLVKTTITSTLTIVANTKIAPVRRDNQDNANPAAEPTTKTTMATPTPASAAGFMSAKNAKCRGGFCDHLEKMMRSAIPAQRRRARSLPETTQRPANDDPQMPGFVVVDIMV